MKFITIILFLCLPCLSLANGAGIDGFNIPYTGQPRFVQKNDIKLLKEKLYIKFSLDSAYVHVSYTFLNNSGGDNIEYGFPVDYYVTGNLKIYADDGPDDWVEVPEPRDIQFIINGKTLDYKEGEDIALPKNEEKRRKWFYTNFSIDEGSMVELEVKYSLHCGSEDYLSEKSSSEFGARHFYYDFDAGQYWGDGIADVFEVEINFTENPTYEIDINGLPFIENNKKYTYKTLNFNFKPAKQLEVIYEVSKIFSRQEKIYTKTDKQLSANASSALSNYPASYMTDSNFETAWAAKDNGINQSVEIFIPENEYIYTLAIYNGYLKNLETYYNNARIKNAKVEYYKNDEIFMEQDFYFSDPQYISDAGFIDMAEFIPVHFGTKKIKITILEVYPGKKYNDVCISEIALHRYFYPGRSTIDFINASKAQGKPVIRAVSPLKNYPVENLTDGDFSTAWVIKDTDAINQTIEIDIPDTGDRYCIIFYNGYLKSKDTYYNNSKIKKAKAEYYYKGEFVSEEWYYFQDYEYFSYSNYKNMATFCHLNHYIDNVKITIEEIYPGKKYEETCISEIIVYKLPHDD